MSDISYTYTVLKYRPKDSFLQVKYERVGYDPIIRNLVPPVVTLETAAAVIAAFCEERAPIGAWAKQDLLAGLENVVVSTDPTAGVYTPPLPPEPPTPPTLAEQIEQRVAEVVREAELHAGGGVLWTAPGGQVYGIYTNDAAIAKMKDMRLQIAGGRTTSALWRLKKLTAEGDLETTHISLTPAQFGTMVTQVIAHLDKSLQAEATTVTLTQAGDLNVDYITEYAKL